MKVGDLVLVDSKKGRIIWIDNPWSHNDGTPADLLCKITFDGVDGFKWHRISELNSRMEDIKENKMETTGKEKIEFSEFIEIEKKLEIKIGKVTEVEDVTKSNKLIKLTVDFGTETRTVVTNIKPHLTDPRLLVNMMFPFITNLKPVTMMGIESTAMIMPGEVESGSIASAHANPGTKLL